MTYIVKSADQVVVWLVIVKKTFPYNKMLRYYNKKFFLWEKEDSNSYSETFCRMLFVKEDGIPCGYAGQLHSRGIGKFCWRLYVRSKVWGPWKSRVFFSSQYYGKVFCSDFYWSFQLNLYMKTISFYFNHFKVLTLITFEMCISRHQ